MDQTSQSYTLENIYYNEDKYIEDWLRSMGYELVDPLTNRLNVTKIIAEMGYLNKKDLSYMRYKHFDFLYMLKEEEIAGLIKKYGILGVTNGYDIPNDSKLDMIRNYIDYMRYGDTFAKNIFDIFVAKDAAMDVNGKRMKRIQFEIERNKLTRGGRTKLENMANTIEDMYNRFISKVEYDRQFSEKSGGSVRRIDTPRDWAEAIIEFEDLSAKFDASFEQQVAYYTSDSYLKLECSEMDKQSCHKPCELERGLFNPSGKCVYKNK